MEDKSKTMEYQMNFGCWGSVFAVPSAVVDHFIKLASETQLKVLLFLLRGGSQNISSAQIAEYFRISEEQAEDAVQFWVQANILQPPRESSALQQFDFMQPTTPPPAQNTPQVQAEPKIQSQRSSKEIKLDPTEIAHSLEQSQELKDLFLCAEKLFGRFLNHMEQRSLLWIHSYLGMRSEVLLTLLGYCVSINKVSMSYAESIAISWMEQDITTLQLAEAEIKQLTDAHSYLSNIRKMFEMQHSPTSQQKKYIESWSTAGYSMDLIQCAYEITIESIEKLNFKYINTILEKWAAQGITTPEQARAQRRSGTSASAKPTAQETAELDEYLSVVNRFRKE